MAPWLQKIKVTGLSECALWEPITLLKVCCNAGSNVSNKTRISPGASQLSDTCLLPQLSYLLCGLISWQQRKKKIIKTVFIYTYTHAHTTAVGDLPPPPRQCPPHKSWQTLIPGRLVSQGRWPSPCTEFFLRLLVYLPLPMDELSHFTQQGFQLFSSLRVCRLLNHLATHRNKLSAEQKGYADLQTCYCDCV